MNKRYLNLIPGIIVNQPKEGCSKIDKGVRKLSSGGQNQNKKPGRFRLKKVIDIFIGTSSVNPIKDKEKQLAQNSNVNILGTQKTALGNQEFTIPRDLVSEKTLNLSGDVFSEYVTVKPGKKSLRFGFTWLDEKIRRHQFIKYWNHRRNVVRQAFDTVNHDEIAALGFALGIQATRRLGTDDAVDFMLTLTEILSKVSHHFDINCSRYMKFAVSMEIFAGDFRRLSIGTGLYDEKLDMLVPVSVRGRLVFLAAAEADEVCKRDNPEIDEQELLKKSEQKARTKCKVLFEQSWCQFDGAPYGRGPVL